MTQRTIDNTPSMRMKAGVCGVIVTYNPSVRMLDNARAVAAQVHHLVIVDNASCPASASLLIELKHDLAEHVTLISNERNVGIAAALNQGARFATEGGYTWLLTLDQDSEVDASMVPVMLRAYGALPDRSAVGVLAPTSIDAMTGQPSPLYDIREKMTVADGRDGVTEVALIHTSGNLINTRVFDEGIYFREEYFIDCVDTEFCLRLRRHGHRVVVVRDAMMRHATGDIARGHVWRKDFVYPTHSANRNYYMTRNAIALFLETRNGDFLIPYLRNLTLQYAFSLLFEEEKWPRVVALMQGIRDGIMRQLGPRGEQTYQISRQRRI